MVHDNDPAHFLASFGSPAVTWPPRQDGSPGRALVRLAAPTRTAQAEIDTALPREGQMPGVLLRGEPTAQFVAPTVYLHAAWLLYEALEGSGELTRALSPRELPPIGRDLCALLEEQASRRMPNWRELLPLEAFDQT